MSTVTDTNGQSLTYLNLVATESTETNVFVIRFPALANYVLTADADSIGIVSERKTGSNAAFQNIASNPISLTPFANTTVDYDVKVQAGAVAIPVDRRTLPVRIRPG